MENKKYYQLKTIVSENKLETVVGNLAITVELGFDRDHDFQPFISIGVKDSDWLETGRTDNNGTQTHSINIPVNPSAERYYSATAIECVKG